MCISNTVADITLSHICKGNSSDWDRTGRPIGEGEHLRVDSIDDENGRTLRDIRADNDLKYQTLARLIKIQTGKKTYWYTLELFDSLDLVVFDSFRLSQSFEFEVRDLQSRALALLNTLVLVRRCRTDIGLAARRRDARGGHRLGALVRIPDSLEMLVIAVLREEVQYILIRPVEPVYRESLH